MNQNFAMLGAVIDQLQQRLSIVMDEIKADREGLAAYNAILKRIRLEKELTELRLKHAREWLEEFDRRIGPFDRKYDTLTGEIGTLYDKAVEKHANGLALLEAEFDYHPAFKQASGGFEGIPFKPKSRKAMGEAPKAMSAGGGAAAGKGSGRGGRAKGIGATGRGAGRGSGRGTGGGGGGAARGGAGGQ